MAYPPLIIDALGAFDLDPCAPVFRPWPTAAIHYTIEDDGLTKPWAGRVWLNPPFGGEAIKWLRRMVQHRHGIALVPARTETKMFFECVWGTAHAVMFLRGRPHFHYVDGRRASANSGAPIALISWSAADTAAMQRSGLGAVVRQLTL